MKFDKSGALFKRASLTIPGGVNSPVRAFRHVGGDPIYLVRGEGAKVFDVDGNGYVDFCGSWGPLILGHACREVVEAVRESSLNGLSFGACTPVEIEMAELLKEQIPALEMVRMVSSGTEATMTALRLARGFTGRAKVLKFEGCYHGHSDAFLVSAGSGLLTQGLAASAGVTAGTIEDTLVIPYNNMEALEEVFARYGDELAAVIIEPVAGNMGLIKPLPGFLEGIIEVARRYGALTIFDEVITGFRFGPTAYSTICGLKPDLLTLGKIVGGGLPVGAVGGRAEIMRRLAPLGDVYQAGTLSGNPVALSAGIATIKRLRELNPYAQLAHKNAGMAKELDEYFERNGLPSRCVAYGSMFTIFFIDRALPLNNLSEVKKCDTGRFARYFQAMLRAGFYLPPAQFEAAFLSVAHTDADLQQFIAKTKAIVHEIL